MTVKKSNNGEESKSRKMGMDEQIRVALDIEHNSLMTYFVALISITVLQFAFFSLFIQGSFVPVRIVKTIFSGGAVVLCVFQSYLVLELYSTYVEIIHLREELEVNITLNRLRQELSKRSWFLRKLYNFHKHHWAGGGAGLHIGLLPKLVVSIMLFSIPIMCLLTLSTIWNFNSVNLLQLIEGMDYELFLSINQVSSPILNSFFLLVSFICSYVPYFLIAAIIWARRPKLGTLLLIALAIVSAFLFFTKAIVSRPRPPQVLSNVKVLEHFGGSSFPSGHSTRAFLLASIVGSSYTKAVAPLFIFSTLVAISRVYVGAHFPTDTIVGAILGIVIGRVLHTRQNLFSPFFRISEWVHAKILSSLKISGNKGSL